MVVARYKEDLEWLTEVPDHFQIIVYNKGPFIESEGALKRISRVIERENNLGREADTYLKFLCDGWGRSSEWSVFTQGDPFSHSPDFLQLLHSQHLWKDMQPLTWRWLEERFIPPPELLESERDAWIGALRIRKERYSLHTWNSFGFDDSGAISLGRAYANHHGLSGGSNLAAHFFASAGMEDLAVQAEEADFGVFNYGAIFAVRNSLIDALRADSLSKLLEISSGHYTHPYLLEKLWLHLFGEPFLHMTGGESSIPNRAPSPELAEIPPVGELSF